MADSKDLVTDLFKIFKQVPWRECGISLVCGLCTVGVLGLFVPWWAPVAHDYVALVLRAYHVLLSLGGWSFVLMVIGAVVWFFIGPIVRRISLILGFRQK